MSEVKFTKGPWYVYNNDVYLEVFSDKGAICDTCMSGHQFDDGDCTEGKFAKANAHLIAAAPEMYQVIEDFRRAFLNLLEFDLVPIDHEKTVQEKIIVCNKLLAKARGE